MDESSKKGKPRGRPSIKNGVEPNSRAICFKKYCSATRSTRTKTFSTAQFTEEEIQKLGKAWMDEIDKINTEFREKKKQEKVESILTNRKSLNKQIKKCVNDKCDCIKCECTDCKCGIVDVPIVVDAQQKPIVKEENIPMIEDDIEFPVISLSDSVKLIQNSSPDTGYTMGMFGSSKSGKTTLLNDIFDKLKKDSISFIFSENLSNPIYSNIKNDKNVIGRYQFSEKLINEAYLINKGTENHYQWLVILDDIVDEKNNETLKKLFTIYRNSNFRTVLMLQDCQLMKKTNRGNVNYIYLLKMNNDEMIEDCLEKFIGGFFKGSRDMKIAKYKSLTQNYNKLFIDLLNNKLYVIPKEKKEKKEKKESDEDE
jgi:hypothetical protein